MIITDLLANFFSDQLVLWQQTHPRDYPWIGASDPYHILLSEFLLQQTRSDQALPYYRKFINVFPDIHALARADETEILRLWQGLGYYNRGRNLHKTAKRIVENHKGIISSEYHELLKLPGIGPYTAAAIASFAFNKRHAVVDGNVIRVLSRFFNIKETYAGGTRNSTFHRISARLIENQEPAIFNQGIMNLGADICTPKNYKCQECPLKNHCYAYTNDLQPYLPIKAKKKTRRHRYFHYFHIRQDGKLFIHKRNESDIWQHLYQFPMIETQEPFLDYLKYKRWFDKLDINDQSPSIPVAVCSHKQTLTHQHIHAFFYIIDAEYIKAGLKEGWSLVNTENLDNFAFPKTMNWYLELFVTNHKQEHDQ